MHHNGAVPDIPVIDIGPLRGGPGDRPGVAAEIDAACRGPGFFYVVNHGVDAEMQAQLERLARRFFALPEAEKAEVAMGRGGAAWRGWFPVGAELTSGIPDTKEGLYFGDDQPPCDLPLHGPNLYPARPAGFGDAVAAYIAALTDLGHAIMRGVALALGLPEGWFAEHLTGTPTVLFRIFSYPPDPAAAWGVGEHTDYGLLTMLRQDATGGLEVRSPGGWREAPPVPGSFVCNLGDMLELMTGGRYRSTPHRVRNTGPTSRLSFPFFFDPAWDAKVVPLPVAAAVDRVPRWDGADIAAFRGTYGEYLLAKVAKVFPDLGRQVL